MSDITTNAQDSARELAIRAHVALHDVASRARNVVERAKEERGQTGAEYMGVLLLVSVIIAALFASGVGKWIAEGVKELVQDIAQGKDDGTTVGD
jgi:hypothetical protein